MRQRVLLSGSIWSKMIHPIRTFNQIRALNRNRRINSTVAILFSSEKLAPSVGKVKPEDKPYREKTRGPVGIVRMINESGNQYPAPLDTSIELTMKMRTKAMRNAFKKHANTRIIKYTDVEGQIRGKRELKSNPSTKKLPAAK